MKQYEIKEVSKLTELPASTLRYYEKLGLLKNVARDKNGRRLYTDSHLERLEGIKCFKDGGLPITKICDFYRFDDSLDKHIDDILELVIVHEKSLSEEIGKKQKQLLHIQQKIRYYHGIKAALESGQELPYFEDFE